MKTYYRVEHKFRKGDPWCKYLQGRKVTTLVNVRKYRQRLLLLDAHHPTYASYRYRIVEITERSIK